MTNMSPDYRNYQDEEIENRAGTRITNYCQDELEPENTMNQQRPESQIQTGPNSSVMFYEPRNGVPLRPSSQIEQHRISQSGSRSKSSDTYHAYINHKASLRSSRGGIGAEKFEFIAPQQLNANNQGAMENFNRSVQNKRSVHVPNQDNRVEFELTTITNNADASKQFTTAQMSSLIPKGIHENSQHNQHQNSRNHETSVSPHHRQSSFHERSQTDHHQSSKYRSTSEPPRPISYYNTTQEQEEEKTREAAYSKFEHEQLQNSSDLKAPKPYQQLVMNHVIKHQEMYERQEAHQPANTYTTETLPACSPHPLYGALNPVNFASNMYTTSHDCQTPMDSDTATPQLHSRQEENITSHLYEDSEGQPHTYSIYTDGNTPNLKQDIRSEKDQKHSTKALLPPLPKRYERVEQDRQYHNTTISHEDEKTMSPRDLQADQNLMMLNQQSNEHNLNSAYGTAMFAQQHLRNLSAGHHRQSSSADVRMPQYKELSDGFSPTHFNQFDVKKGLKNQQEMRHADELPPELRTSDWRDKVIDKSRTHSIEGTNVKHHSHMSSVMSAQFQPLLNQEQRKAQAAAEERLPMSRGMSSRNGQIRSGRSQDGRYLFTLGEKGIMSGQRPSSTNLNQDVLSLNLDQSPIALEQARNLSQKDIKLQQPYKSTLSSPRRKTASPGDKLSPLKSQFHHQQNISQPSMKQNLIHSQRHARPLSQQPLSSYRTVGTNNADQETQQMMTQFSQTGNATGELSQTAQQILSQHKETIREAEAKRQTADHSPLVTSLNIFADKNALENAKVQGSNTIQSQRISHKPPLGMHPMINDPSITHPSQGLLGSSLALNQAQPHFLSAQQIEDIGRLGSRKGTFQTTHSPDAAMANSINTNRLPPINEQLSIDDMASQNHSQVASLHNANVMFKQELVLLRKQLADARSTHLFLKKQNLQLEHQNNLQQIKITQLEEFIGQRENDTAADKQKLEQLADLYKSQEDLGQELARKQSESEQYYQERLEMFDQELENLRSQKVKNHYNVQANLLQLSSGISYLTELFGEESYLVPFLVHFERVCQVLQTQVSGDQTDFQDKTQEQVELQMKHMKKVQSFDKFKREVRNLVKNHYKAKIAEKVQLKVTHKMQAKEEELQKVTKYAKKAEKHLKKVTDQFGKLNKLYEEAQENISEQIQERERMVAHFEEEKEALLQIHTAEVGTLRQTIKQMHKKIKLVEKLRQEASIAHVSHHDNQTQHAQSAIQGHSESITINVDEKENFASNAAPTEGELLALQNEQFRETLDRQNLLIGELQRALLQREELSRYRSSKSGLQSTQSQLLRVEDSSRGQIINVPLKSERSDNKITETNQTESEATSADGEVEPERIGDKPPNFARQPERGRVQKNLHEVGPHVSSSVQCSGQAGQVSSDYFHDTTPLTTPQDLTALQSAYLETTNENQNEYLLHEFSLGKRQRGGISQQDLQRESSVKDHVDRARKAVKQMQLNSNRYSSQSSHNNTNRLTVNLSEPRIGNFASTSNGQKQPEYDRYDPYAQNDNSGVNILASSDGQSATHIPSAVKPSIESQMQAQAVHSFDATPATCFAVPTRHRRIESQSIESSALTKKTDPSKLPGHVQGHV